MCGVHLTLASFPSILLLPFSYLMVVSVHLVVSLLLFVVYLYHQRHGLYCISVIYSEIRCPCISLHLMACSNPNRPAASDRRISGRSACKIAVFVCLEDRSCGCIYWNLSRLRSACGVRSRLEERFSFDTSEDDYISCIAIVHTCSR